MSRRPFYAVDAIDARATSRRGRERARCHGDGVDAMPRRLDGVDAAARDPTRRVHDQSLNAGRARL